ncbi:MAG: hypothetical protein M1522_08655 [Actinobacteria bacterium]|jgi:hypothetical protein|nr:hypothetical protein [Actinomycetota bacterium]
MESTTTVTDGGGKHRETSSADYELGRLEYLRGELRAERISYGELFELQTLAHRINPGDVELLEAAGVPEYPDEVEYTVAVSNIFTATGPVDAVRQMAEWLRDNCDFAGYRVTDEAGGSWFIDPENICRTCGNATTDDGEGWDGECGNCADRAVIAAMRKGSSEDAE